MSWSLQTADANLSVKVTLDWYFEAMERGLSELMVETGGITDDIEICVIGHSIGGWVARAYLGGLSGYVCLRRRSNFVVAVNASHRA